MISDPNAALRDRVFQRVLHGEAASSPALRKAAFEGAGLSPDLKPLIDKVHAHAYKVSDEDVAKVQGAYGDDALFEIIVSAALGASNRRLQAGLQALADA
jgi:hypothetical protein